MRRVRKQRGIRSPLFFYIRGQKDLPKREKQNHIHANFIVHKKYLSLVSGERGIIVKRFSEKSFRFSQKFYGAQKIDPSTHII